MIDKENPLKDVWSVSIANMVSRQEIYAKFELQVNEFVDQNSNVGIFTGEPEPFNFFSVDK